MNEHLEAFIGAFLAILAALAFVGIIATMTLFFPISAHAQLIDINIIAQIESSGQAWRINPHTGAAGLCQIMPVCLADYNQFHEVKYSYQDLLNPAVNKKIASWYLNRRIPQLVKHKGRKITKRNILICYNAGHIYLTKKLKPETVTYLKKYAIRERGKNEVFKKAVNKRINKNKKLLLR